MNESCRRKSIDNRIVDRIRLTDWLTVSPNWWRFFCRQWSVIAVCARYVLLLHSCRLYRCVRSVMWSTAGCFARIIWSVCINPSYYVSKFAFCLKNMEFSHKAKAMRCGSIKNDCKKSLPMFCIWLNQNHVCISLKRKSLADSSNGSQKILVLMATSLFCSSFFVFFFSFLKRVQSDPLIGPWSIDRVLWL